MTDKDTGIYVGMGSLGNYARNSAATDEVSTNARMKMAIIETRQSILKLKRISARYPDLPESYQWIYDNCYLAEREGKRAIMRLKEARTLPAVSPVRPRIIETAMSLVYSGRGEVTPERIELFLSEYQKISVLTERELSVFLPALTCELIVFLCGVAEKGVNAPSSADTGVVFKNVFTSLRLLFSFDFTDILEGASKVEEALKRDPSGIYSVMDEDTRRYYRLTVSRLAKKYNMSEINVVNEAIKLAESSADKHVGTFLLKKPLGKQAKPADGTLYISLITILTAFTAVFLGIKFSSVPAALLLVIPVSEIVKNVVDFIAVRCVHPRRLPRIELKNGVPKIAKTICVISVILGSDKDGVKYAGALEEYMLLNRDAGENLMFGILADFPEHTSADKESDKGCISAATEAIAALNKKYGERFCLLIRRRELNSDGVYMGRERKRGAIMELVKLLSGKESTMLVYGLSRDKLVGTNYIITLDADTRVTAGSILELIGTAMHPINVPVLDKEKGCVKSGYGILQPRMATDLECSDRSDFTRIFAGQGGIDPYSSTASEVYQDLFGEGSFSGKGLINVPAYESCLIDAFPENIVLSHDLLEGAYLRCGYASDIEFTDSFPFKVTSYFSRMNRWTRGDWQNIRYLRSRVKNALNQVCDNPINEISKWKIFDNLRRSLVPVTIFLSLFAGTLIGSGAFLASAAIALLAHASGLVISSTEMFLRHDGSTKLRYHSTVIPGAAGAVMMTFVRLLLLPAEAWTQFTAVAASVYRMTVSHRKLLEWVTASESEKRYGNTIRVNYIKLAVCPIAGIIAIILNKNAGFGALGLVWIFAPAYAWALSREYKEDKRIYTGDRSFLSECANDIWRFFKMSVTPEDNFLPVDNIQVEPSLGKAHRTSPTNIGLGLMAALSAYDLGIIERQELTELLDNMLSTIERLDKWCGHLYNWYDTETCTPLEPRYVSTVDSGNLAACLLTLKGASEELGDEALGGRCERLLANMSFKPLYDKRRKLFYIGWDMAKDAPSEGWYDLLSSEARTTSFIAVALGDVPRKHWSSLGRSLVSLDNFSGMASWTGTMFEYLMPNLFLPCYKNSLIFESTKFCVYAQRRNNPKIPWGVSESAFYAFDPGMAYSYKAHGVQRLALKRDMARDSVIAPYASFLALGVEPMPAIRNLKNIMALGAVGECGYYDAIDFTPSRQIDGKYEVVYTYMAHHLGMSIMAIDNVLTGDIMQKRFMKDVRMRAYRELLQEKLPIGQVVLKLPSQDVPEKPEKLITSRYCVSSSSINPYSPRCIPLSNGRYRLLVSENGKTLASWENRMVTRWERDVLGAVGTEIYLKAQGKVRSLLPAPLYDRSVSYSFEFSGDEAVFRAQGEEFSSEVRINIPSSSLGEVWSVSVESNGEAELIYAFEPVMDIKSDYEAHPAFSRLCMEAYRKENGVTFRRRKRSDRRDAYLCLACDHEGECRTSPERGVFPESASFKKLSPEMRASYSVPLEAGEQTVRFAKCVSYDRHEAESCADRMVKKTEKASVSRLEASSVMLGLKSLDISLAMSYITELVYTKPKADENVSGYDKKSLWRFGISGDNPIISAVINSGEEIKNAVSLARRHAFLTENGIVSDLVFLLTDGGDYRSEQLRGVRDFLAKAGRTGTIGKPGGVFLVDSKESGTEAITVLSSITVNLSDERLNETEQNVSLPYVQERYTKRHDGKLAYRFTDNCEFKMAMQRSLPPLNWSNVLTNGNFGVVVTETGSGYMWTKNSHELRINRWVNDPLSESGSERLELLRNGRHIPLFASGDEYPCVVTYGLGYETWEKDVSGTKIKLTAFVPPSVSARVFILETENALGGDRLLYSTNVILGVNGEGHVSAKNENGMLTFDSKDSEMSISFTSSAEPECFTTDNESFLRDNLDCRLVSGKNVCAAMQYRISGRLVLVCGSESGGTLRSLCDYGTAMAALEETRRYWQAASCPVTVKTPDDRLNRYINGWALYQVLASRLMARTSLYQSGGAVGFRDQLQDSMAFIASQPKLTAEQIKVSCEHQYLEGDVQHWWHSMPDGSHGVRTRITDDLMWLPYVLYEYVEKTGDYGICRIKARYLESPELRTDENSRYEVPKVSEVQETILDHAKRAADRFMERGVGKHGLALIGGGDWNDGLNSVGDEGEGESEWLSWFGSIALWRLSELCRKDGDKRKADKYAEFGERLKRSAENAWDGEWFLRGYYDDGSLLGSHKSEGCRIDSIAQSFAVFAGADREKTGKALNSALRELHSDEKRITKLFSPPFIDSGEEPGYIKSYGEGFRENGGQYTHGAVWLGGALLDFGRTDEGYSVLRSVLPGDRDLDTYKGEPFVIAADIYSGQDNEGRCGWSWYTGAAGWMYRTVIQKLLGIKEKDSRLYIEPRLPKDWNGFEATVKLGGEIFNVKAVNGDETEITVNGKPYVKEGYALKGFQSLAAN